MVVQTAVVEHSFPLMICAGTYTKYHTSHLRHNAPSPLVLRAVTSFPSFSQNSLTCSLTPSSVTPSETGRPHHHATSSDFNNGKPL